jgi:beta-1,2-mannobiose phosphorylase / 1,2-beta-oligomannan phosphorylase
VREQASGWRKYEKNPVIGGRHGTCFDVSVLTVDGVYRMYLSWRPRKAIALCESRDGLSWTEPRIVLDGLGPSSWEWDVNRPSVIRHDGRYQMWYTAQDASEDGTGSRLGCATSVDGLSWVRSGSPVMEAHGGWEGGNIMCPHVLFDDDEGLYKLWYSAGERYEPDSIGYATSLDGITWQRARHAPVFGPHTAHPWEAYKVTAAQVIKTDGGYLMFYIGFENLQLARIGVARSPDGVDGWERSAANPIIGPDPEAWDAEACYKPFAVREKDRWILWYNGRAGSIEQIGVAFHTEVDLGFRG